MITPEGIKEPGYKRNKPTTVKEYGGVYLLLEQNKDIVKGLKKYFPDWWKEILVISFLRVMHKLPFKHMRLQYKDSWISEEIKNVKLSERSLHTLLEEVGKDRSSIIEFLRSFISGGETLLIDLTHIFSLSENMLLAAKGYNSEFDFTPQVNLLFMFSPAKRLPLFYRILPGNVRDVSSLKTIVKESGINDAIIVTDKGFYSKDNLRLLQREKLNFILPLKRKSSLIDYEVIRSGDKKKFEGYFKFKKRFIWYYNCGKGKLPVWVFLDERLKVKEQEDYLTRIKTHPEFNYTIEGFHKNLFSFGTIGVVTNLKNASAKKVFEYLKSRGEIEVKFDTFKNILKADRTYMRTDASMESWMFINYLALIYHYKIYHLLIQHDLLSKYSPSDVLLYLSKYRKVKVSSHWLSLEIPKQTRKLMEKINLPIT